MAFEAGYRGRLLAGSYSLSQFTDSISTSATTDMLDVTVHESPSNAKAFIPGLSSSSLSCKGPADVDGASTSLLGQLNAWKGGSDTPVTFGHKGYAVGSELILVNGIETNLEFSATNAGRVEWTLGAMNDNLTSHNGYSIHDLTAESANGTGTEFDGTASSALGAVGHLHVTAFSGFTNIIVKIQTATTSGGAYSDLITFSTVTGVTSQRSIVTGTVNRYVQAVWTKTGTGSATFAVGLARL